MIFAGIYLAVAAIVGIGVGLLVYAEVAANQLPNDQATALTVVFLALVWPFTLAYVFAIDRVRR